MKILTTAIIKGGTGKSTTAAAIAQAAKANKKKVLCIDLDPQGNLTPFLDGEPGNYDSYSFLTGEQSAQNVIQKTSQGIDLIPAGTDLATLKTTPGSAKRLQRAINTIQDNYDYIICDTPPLMGETIFNALQASNGLIIPLECDNNSIQGLYQIVDIAEHIKEASNPDLSFIGVFVARYDQKPKLNRYFRDLIENTAKELNITYLGEIRAGIAIKEAQAFRQSLFEYSKQSKQSKDYTDLYKQIKKRV